MARLVDRFGMFCLVQRHTGRNVRRSVERGMTPAVAAMPALCDNRRCGAAPKGLLSESIILALTITNVAPNNVAITATASMGVARAGETTRVANAMAITSFFMFI